MRRIVMRSPTSLMKKILAALFHFKSNSLDKCLNTNIKLTGRLLRNNLVLIFFIELVNDLITILFIMWSSCVVVIRVFQSFSYRYRSHPVDTLQSLGTLLLYYTSFEQLFVVHIKFCPCKATIRAPWTSLGDFFAHFRPSKNHLVKAKSTSKWAQK